MTEDNWTDRIAAERMRVDRQFEDRVASSSFSRQQWGLVMTAVEFDIENPEDPEQATLRADTSKLSSVMSQVEDIGKRGGGMGGGGGHSSSGSSGGLFSAVTSALGLGGGGNSQLEAEAEDLTAEYAKQLQKQLEDRDRWETVCADVSSK